MQVRRMARVFVPTLARRTAFSSRCPSPENLPCSVNGCKAQARRGDLDRSKGEEYELQHAQLLIPAAESNHLAYAFTRERAHVYGRACTLHLQMAWQGAGGGRQVSVCSTQTRCRHALQPLRCLFACPPRRPRPWPSAASPRCCAESRLLCRRSALPARACAQSPGR